MRSLLLSSFLLVTLATAPAMADDSAPSSADIKRAAASYDLGRERIREENYVEAAERFETADDHAPSAVALRWAITARKEAGHLDRAATLAALALARYPENEALAEQAQGVIDEVGGDLAKLSVTCDSACELLLNNKIVHGQSAESRVLYVEPGSVSVRASWSEDRNESETVEVQAGDEQEVSFYAPVVVDEPAAEPAADAISMETSSEDPVADSGEAKGWHPGIFYTGLGLTVVGGGATVLLGLNAQNNPGKDVVREMCVSGDTSCPEYEEGRRNQMFVNIAVGATAAFGAFTIVSAFLTDWGGGDEESATLREGDLSIRPTFAVGDGALLGATGTF